MIFINMTKDLLLEILTLSKEKCIPEKDAAFELCGKRMCLNYYKNKYGIELWKNGESPMSRNKRKMTLNDYYFDNISPETSYYAGFIAADGNIDKNNKKLTISLSSKDRKHLETFLEKIESDSKIYEYKTNGFDISTIVINSEKICSDLLKNFNITPKKSLTYTPPTFNDNTLKDSFIVGIIDGDGTISFTKSNNKTRMYISLIGTFETIMFVKNRFEEILGKSTSSPYKRSENTYTIRISDKTARLIFEHYYSLNIPKLERKWKTEIYEYCVNYRRKIPISKRKGVNIFNLDGEFLMHFDTLKEASDYTGVSCGRISSLCKCNNNNHMAHGYMFSRNVIKLDKYEQKKSFR